MDFLGSVKSNSCHEYPVDIMEELKAIEEMEQAGKRAKVNGTMDHLAEETKKNLQEEARKKDEAEKLAREKAIQDEVRRLLEEEERLAKEKKISEMKKRQQEERIRVENMVAQRKLEQEMEHKKKMEYEESKRKRSGTDEGTNQKRKVPQVPGFEGPRSHEETRSTSKGQEDPKKIWQP